MERANRWAIPVVEDGVYRGIFTSDRLMHVYKIVSDQTSGRKRLIAALGDDRRAAPGPARISLSGTVRSFG